MEPLRISLSDLGIGRILTKMNIMNAWRTCVPVDGSTIQPDDQRDIHYALIEEQASGGVTSRR